VRQLLQRISFHYRLGGLKKNEIGHYLAHRLRVAGFRGESLFTPAATRALHRASGGTPRLINILAHKALLAVFGEGRQLTKVRHIRLAAKDTEGARRVGWLW
jgi:MSHA biogenesis protein MshM